MNIKEAKDEIQRAITSYLMKDEFGEYRISRVRQRPILLKMCIRDRLCTDTFSAGTFFMDWSCEIER